MCEHILQSILLRIFAINVYEPAKKSILGRHLGITMTSYWCILVV